jgi:tetratricopeptide (TPR) repeat protein
MTAIPVTTDNDKAAALLVRGIDSFNRWRIDAIPLIDAALEQDPSCVMAHTMKGLIMAGGRNTRFVPIVNESLRQAHAAQAGVTLREQHYVKTLTALATGRIHDAVAILEAMLNQHPTDLLAHRLVQQELFWMGEAGWMRDIAARAWPAWSEQTPGYSGFLSVYAFSHEEAGEHTAAEQAGRAAVERDPHDCWGAHAVAHVLEMQGRYDEGAGWLEGLSDNWHDAIQIAHHLWWHLCLFCLEQQQHERILELLDQKVRNPDSPLVKAAPDAYIDIQNVASLLLRLELRGVDVGERWHTVADVAAQRIANHLSPFTSAHAAMILAACGRFEEAAQLVQSMWQFAADDRGSLGSRVQVAAIPAAEAALAHRRGDYESVIRWLLPARRDLWRMGGSHAQRDVFIQMLADACHKLNRHDYLTILFDENARVGFDRVRARSFYNEIVSNG